MCISGKDVEWILVVIQVGIQGLQVSCQLGGESLSEPICLACCMVVN